MMINGINTSEISVVIQGAIDNVNTPLSIKSIRKHLPGAEIIISTWEGTDVSKLDYDKVVLNKDPGAWKDIKTNFVNNMNRQITSTVNGLKSSSRKYCIKIRSDIIFRSNKFLKYYNEFEYREEEYILFKQRIIVCSFFFKKYLGEFIHVVHPTPFHISDWFAFGLKSDLLLLYDVPLSVEPDNTNYLLGNYHSKLKKNMFGASHQYAPEQYIFYNCVKKKFDNRVQFRDIVDYNSNNIDFSDRINVNNCISLEPYQMSLYCAKNGVDPYKEWSKDYLKLPKYVWEGLYRHDVFLSDYKKYCDNKYKISFRVKFNKKIYLMFHKYFTVRSIT